MEKITGALLHWYDENHRSLPWRIAPDALKNGAKPNPYRVWLSEVMLQQTTVEAVKSYFTKFIQKWPTIEALATASEDDVLKAWAGLGYYSRARNLKACAEKIVSEFSGHFPEDIKRLKTLPGIGDYTAAAIAAIAFDKPEAVVDGNVERVISRLYCIATPLPAAKAEIRTKTQFLTPTKRAGDFAQSMMDLGATLCSPKRPSCFLCPVKEDCMALLHDEPERFPVKPPKKERPSRYGAAFIALSDQGRVYLQKRPNHGLLASMSEVPNFFAPQKSDDNLIHAPFNAPWQFKGQATHIFTHFSLTLDVYFCANIDEKNGKNGWWCQMSDIGEEALPTVMKKAIHIALPTLFFGK